MSDKFYDALFIPASSSDPLFVGFYVLEEAGQVMLYPVFLDS